MTFAVSTRDACRICGGADLRRFFRLDRAPMTDGFVTAETAGREFVHPLEVYWCAGCATAQTLHDVDVSGYYQDYLYTISHSELGSRFMHRLAERLFERYGLRRGDRIMDIGSGDGAQLAAFAELGARVLGFEPSAPLCAASRAAGVPVVEGLFTAETAREVPAGMRPAQAIVLANTLDHIPDPVGVLRAAASLLDYGRGILVVEVHDLAKIVDRRETCLFHHEHAVYLTVATMRRMLERAGLALVSASLLDESERRGNSLLVAAAHPGSIHTPERAPEDPRFDDWATYAGFEADVQRSYAALAASVRGHVGAGRTVAGYGAGGRGVLTLAAAGLAADEVAFVCDRNPAVHGRLTPATHIPIVAPEHLRDHPVDELVVFSFGYLDEIRAQLAFHTERGGRITSMLDLL
jgi:SAM-dependent methyltransferase